MAGRSAIDLAAEIEQDVSSGRLQPGQQLPPVRAQADARGLSPTTVAAAYRRLRERGIVIGKARQGTRVAPQPVWPAARPPSVPTGSIDAMTGNPDPRLLPSLDAALRSVDHDPVVRYGDPIVGVHLLDVARDHFAADGVDATSVTVTSGAMDAIERVIAAQGFRIGDRIGVEDPGHVPVHQLARSIGLELVAIAVDEEGVTPAGLTAALERGVSAVVITPRAQNPTGAALTARRAAELSEVLSAQPEVVVILDDHAGAVAGVDFVAVVPPGPRWAVIRSLSKSLGPDLRLALVAGDSQTVDRAEVALTNGPGWVSQILQRTATHLLSDAAAAELVAAAAGSYRERRQRLIAALAGRGVAATGRSGLNVWIPVGDEQAVVDAARSAGYAIRAGDPYRLASPPAVRVSVTHLTGPQIDELAGAVAGAVRTRPSAASHLTRHM
jgi:DNA-binding transcriptional MocR family regulator